MAENYFTTLNNVPVTGKVEEKNGLKYLSWAYAWQIVKTYHPDATYTIYERETQFGPVNYFTDGKTAWVKTGLTINGVEHIEELPIMNNSNKSIILDAITSTDVNKTIQRSLTKAAARHGVGLALYSGEDLPEASDPNADKNLEKAKKEKEKAAKLSATGGVKPVADATPVGTITPEVATVAESEELAALKKEIGQYAKKVKAAYGDLKSYTAIVKSVTGKDGFRCNVAEESHIPLLKEILAQLKSDPKLQ